MKVYVICIEFDADNGVQFELKPTAYKSEEDAQQALKKQIEFEKANTWIVEYNEDELIIEEFEDSFYCKVECDNYYTKIDIVEVEIED